MLRALALAPLVVVALAALAGCHILGLALPCDRAEDCPRGQSCVQGICGAEGEGEGGEGEGEGGEGEGEGGEGEGAEGEGEGEGGEGEGEGEGCVVPVVDTSVCGGPAAVSDGFDGVLDQWHEEPGSGTVDATGSVLHLSGTDLQIYSRAGVLLGGDVVTMALDTLPSDPAVTFDFALRAGNPSIDDEAVILRESGGQLTCIVQDAAFNQNGSVAGGAFDINAARIWRISTAGSAVVFATSADGQSFNDVCSLSAPIFIDRPLYIGLQLQASVATTVGVRAVNGGETGQVCHIGDLAGALCDGQTAPLFDKHESTGCTISPLAGGGITEVIDPGHDDTSCFVRAVVDYDLDGGYLHVPVDVTGILEPGTPPAFRAGLSTTFTVYDPLTDTSIGMELRQGAGGPSIECGIIDSRLDLLTAGNTNPVPDAAFGAGISDVRVAWDLASSTVSCTVDYPGDSWTVEANVDLTVYEPGYPTVGMFAFDALSVTEPAARLVVEPLVP